MNTLFKKLVATLVVISIILGFLLLNMKITFASETPGKLDLFTKKEPFSGKGPNMPSDAFSLGEDLQINALVTYNDEPVANILVGFEITGPENQFENLTSSRVALTDENGIASINFRTSYLVEASFGEWKVFGSAMICDLIVNDSLTFRVGWIVEIVSIRTVNLNRISQEQFPRGNFMGVELGLKSISMTSKTTCLTVSIYDMLNSLVNSTELNDFVVPPNETVVYAYLFLYLPKTAFVGEATAYACVYTSPINLQGNPYCPEKSTQFLIMPQQFFLTIKTEPASITTIPGEGWYDENTNVSLIAPITLTLEINIKYAFSYWDIDGAPLGIGNNSVTILMDNNHTATAHYAQVIMYTLTILTTPGGSTDPPPGIYYHSAGSNVQVTAIPNTKYIFSRWELNGVNASSEVSYIVSMDGNKTLKAIFSPAPTGWFIPEWVLWPFLPFLILIIILLIILFFYYKRRRRKAESSFYSGWTAWYYCYDLRGKVNR